MSHTIRPILRRALAALGLLTLLAVPLSAQLDPKLQAGKTDFLDLYQKTASGLKPEIVTVFDFTGSMDSIMYHPQYPNNDVGDNDGQGWIYFTVTRARNGTYVCTANLTVGNYSFTAGSDSATNPLIRPDGSILTAADIDSKYVPSSPALPGEAAVPKSSDVRNWIRSLSHVRLTANGRTLDIPVPWTILGPSTIVADRASEWRTQYNTWPLKMTIIDPATMTEIEMDTRYRIPGNLNLDASTGTLSYNLVYGTDYRDTYMNWLFSSTCPVPTTSTPAGVAFANGIPSRTRASAVKDAAMRTWAKHWNKVYWAYRFIHDVNDTQPTENNYGTTLFNDSRGNMPSTDPRTSFTYGGQQRGWFLLNGNSAVGLQRLAAYQSGSNTPLTYAMGNTLAQYNDPNSVFNDIEKGVNAPVGCAKHFLILFTDGFPNTDAGGENLNTPYFTRGVASSPFNADTGNKTIMGTPTAMNPNGMYWNPINLAAVAAHLGDVNLANHISPPVYPAAGTYPASGGTSASSWLPFYIKERGAGVDHITFDQAHPIQTMTVGLSMAGSATDSTSPKARLFQAAAFGDPAVTTGDLNTMIPFRLLNAADPSSKDPNSVYFFDATDPQTLVDNLDSAFASAGAISNRVATATPTIPFVGLGLSSQIYLGSFNPPKTGGPVWPGDLLMFPTRQVNGQTMILDSTGATASVLDITAATWSASSALQNNRNWSQRKVFTRLPATAAVPNPPLVPFVSKPATGATTQFDAIKAYVATGLATDAAKDALIQFILGANSSGTGTPLPNRSSIMGDIINSAPVAVEYTLTPTVQTGLPTTLAAKASIPGARFRVIFVGTNQGMYHAFGEVSWVDSTIPTAPVTKGVVDELWAFVPTDFLANLDYMQTTKTHRFLADGTPYVYHLDLPSGTATVGNGTVDSTETARVVFGLRKGGRSYYALDIADPFNPKMAWALRADEASTVPTSRIEYAKPLEALAVIQKLGFSTSNLAVGRVSYGSTPTRLRDALFLGGGLSTPEVDASVGATLGRSALALDVKTGNILMAWDFTAAPIAQPTMGPVAAGLVPFEYFLNSGLVQRAYFTDFNGGVWALGSGANSVASDSINYRHDTSRLDNWTVDGATASTLSVRQIYAGAANEYISTLPAPFLTGNVPYVAGAMPVGIAFVTGDRNNPLDLNYTATTMPTQFRAAVVFDYQDVPTSSKAFGLTDLYTLPATTALGTTPAEVIPGNAAFYLANSKHGYNIPFPAKTGGFFPKGINEPLVLGGALFFSYFTPLSSDPCSGGTGETSSNRVCDVLLPVYQGNGVTVTNTYTGACRGGRVFTWSGVATNFSARSTISVNQGGVVSVAGAGGAKNSSQMQLQTIFGQIKDRLPRPRTWRTVR